MMAQRRAVADDDDDDEEIFDLDAIKKEGRPFKWSFGGAKFAFAARPPIEALEYLTKGDFQMCLYLLLGEDDYARLDALPKRLDDEDFKALVVERYFEKHLGLNLGKSSRPSKSARLTQSARALR